MVEHLGHLLEGPDRRQAAPDDAEVHCGDAKPRADAGHHGVPMREDGGEDHAPAQRNDDVGGGAGGQKGGIALRAPEEHTPDGARRGEHVLASGDGDPNRRRAAQGRAGDAGGQTVAQAPVRWTASVRKRV
jgi:hypothetical protein